MMMSEEKDENGREEKKVKGTNPKREEEKVQIRKAANKRERKRIEVRSNRCVKMRKEITKKLRNQRRALTEELRRRQRVAEQIPTGEGRKVWSSKAVATHNTTLY